MIYDFFFNNENPMYKSKPKAITKEPPCITKSNQSIAFIPSAPPSTQFNFPTMCGSPIGEKPKKIKKPTIINQLVGLFLLFFIR